MENTSQAPRYTASIVVWAAANLGYVTDDDNYFYVARVSVNDREIHKAIDTFDFRVADEQGDLAKGEASAACEANGWHVEGRVGYLNGYYPVLAVTPIVHVIPSPKEN